MPPKGQAAPAASINQNLVDKLFPLWTDSAAASAGTGTTPLLRKRACDRTIVLVAIMDLGDLMDEMMSDMHSKRTFAGNCARSNTMSRHWYDAHVIANVMANGIAR